MDTISKALLIRHNDFAPSNKLARDNVHSTAVSTLISVGFTEERARHVLAANAKELCKLLDCTEEQALFSESAATVLRFRR